MLPYKMLVWVEVDLESETVTDVRAHDYHDNYRPYPAEGSDVIEGLLNLDDVEDGDVASREETATALRVAEEAEKWPELRVEDSDR